MLYAHEVSILSYQTYATPHRPRSCRALPLESAVWQAVERVLHNPALIAAEVDRRREGTSTQQTDLDREREQYNRQLALCEKDLKRWEAAYLGEAIDLADFKAKKTEIDTRRASVQHEIARLDDQQRRLEQVEVETASLVDYCARVRQNLTRFDLAEKRLALEALNIVVTWHPENPLTIQGSIPVDIADNAPWCTWAPPSPPQSAGHGCSPECADTRATAHCCTRR